MRVDRAGAVEIAEAAKKFEWTWTRENLERFAADLRWGELQDSESEEVWLESVTGVLVNRPRAQVFGSDGRVDYLVVTVADMTDDAAEPGPTVSAAFHHVLMGLWTPSGPPAERTVLARFGASWVLDDVVVGVRMGERSVELCLIAPAERNRVLGLQSEAIEEFTSSARWGAGAQTISQLAQADPGDWSRVAMECIVDAIGWERDLEAEAEYGALRSESELGSLWIGRSSANDHGYGFGEYHSADLSLSFPEAVMRIAYLTALDLCVRELGEPSLVGGPHAFATWRRGPITLTLSRRTYGWGSGEVQLELTPTQAAENEDYTYSKYDELWEPSYWWRVRPDRNADRSDVIGMYTPGEQLLTEWEQFDRRLESVFGSLGADLPYIFRFAATLVWVITSVSDTRFIAQGWFSADECHVETYEAGEIVFRDFPPGRSGAEGVTGIVKSAVREAVDSPEQLLHYAFVPSAPQQLWDFRLGLARDTREEP